MTHVFHPQAWLQTWPRDALPFATKDLAVAHGHSEVDLIESPYIGGIEGVVTEPPAALPSEQSVPAPEAVVSDTTVQPKKTKKTATKKAS